MEHRYEPEQEANSHPAAALTEREVNGFTAMVLSTLFGVVYFGWAFFPDTFVTLFTAELVPDRYWALAIPMLICVSTLLATVVYIGLSLRMNPNMDDFRSFCDTDAITDWPSDPSNRNQLKHLVFGNSKRGNSNSPTVTPVFTATETSPPQTRSRTISKRKVTITTSTQKLPPTTTTTTNHHHYNKLPPPPLPPTSS
eukprot:m.138969 g.138969  ORF g.138969 m.138969 type:complete len:197 (-) comp30027_c0_seq1:90-680(-)